MASRQPTATELRLRARHCLILSVGGAIWGVAATLIGLPGFGGQLLLLSVLLVLALLLTAGSVFLFRSAHDLPEGTSRYREWRGFYWAVVRLQYFLIIVTVVLSLFLLPIYHALLIIITIINGLHFIALGPLLRWPSYIKGAALCLLALGTILLPFSLTIRGVSPEPLILWWIVPGFGSTIILWSDALPSLVMALMQVRRASSGYYHPSQAGR